MNSSSFVGLDKLKLYAPVSEVAIQDKCDLTIQPHVVNMATDSDKPKHQDRPLFKTNLGTPVIGQRAYYNDDFINIGIDDKGLKLQFNPKKLEHDTPVNVALKPSTTEGIENALNLIQAHLKAKGIVLNIHDMTVGRIDLEKTRKMNNSFHAYENVFRSMQANRQKPKGIYPSETYMLANSSRQMIFYDKTISVQKNEGIDLGGNYMRTEARLIKKRAAKHFVNHAGELCQSGSIEQLTDQYNHYLDKQIFSRFDKNKQLQSESLNHHDTLKALIDTYGNRTAFNKFLGLIAINTLDNELGGTYGLEQLMKAVGYDKSNVSRRKKGMIELMNIIDDMHQQGSDSPIHGLHELKDKFLH